MKRSADAIIIGAGVIGAATAFELCKRGYRTLNIDRLPGAGYGPTSSSCSIVRAHYSSWDGVAMAHEGFSYWHDWPNYLEIDADDGEIAKYMQSGTVLLKSKTGHHEKVLEHYRNLGVEHEEWDTDTLKSRVPYYDVHAFWPPSRPEDPDFLPQAGRGAGRSDLHERLRLRERPAARHPRPAAGGRGEGRPVPVQHEGRPDPAQRRTRPGRDPRVGRGDRRSGRGERRRPAFVRDQSDGRRRGDDEHKDPRTPPRGPHRAGAAPTSISNTKGSTPPTAIRGSTSARRQGTTS